MSDKSMKSGDDASKKPSAGEASAASTATPASDVTELRQQLADASAREESLKSQLAAAGNPVSMADVERLITDRVAAALAGRPLPSADQSAEQMAKIERERREREEGQSKDLANLEAGPMKFTISMTGEKMMTRLVGGHSPEEAKGKYEKFFGIRALTESTKQIHVAAA